MGAGVGSDGTGGVTGVGSGFFPITMSGGAVGGGAVFAGGGLGFGVVATLGSGGNGGSNTGHGARFNVTPENLPR